ncbi:hypothetical protein MAR_010981 [Mya arenaria]|uniref:Uncharacterized protein n=1 Tax=Mya arenaria TaxID=6604 RepID=A0ABY7FUG7_MYAAR|nr:hypothetical protein MAR_010981 [Mya arenaria]
MLASVSNTDITEKAITATATALEVLSKARERERERAYLRGDEGNLDHLCEEYCEIDDVNEALWFNFTLFLATHSWRSCQYPDCDFLYSSIPATPITAMKTQAPTIPRTVARGKLLADTDFVRGMGGVKDEDTKWITPFVQGLHSFIQAAQLHDEVAIAMKATPTEALLQGTGTVNIRLAPGPGLQTDQPCDYNILLVQENPENYLPGVLDNYPEMFNRTNVNISAYNFSNYSYDGYNYDQFEDYTFTYPPDHPICQNNGSAIRENFPSYNLCIHILLPVLCSIGILGILLTISDNAKATSLPKPKVL